MEQVHQHLLNPSSFFQQHQFRHSSFKLPMERPQYFPQFQENLTVLVIPCGNEESAQESPPFELNVQKEGKC